MIPVGECTGDIGKVHMIRAFVLYDIGCPEGVTTIGEISYVGSVVVFICITVFGCSDAYSCAVYPFDAGGLGDGSAAIGIDHPPCFFLLIIYNNGIGSTVINRISE